MPIDRVVPVQNSGPYYHVTLYYVIRKQIRRLDRNKGKFERSSVCILVLTFNPETARGEISDAPTDGNKHIGEK